MTATAFHSPNHPDNQHFVEFARREMGAQVQIDNFSRDFGRPSIVWRLTGSDGSRVWLKHHERSQLYERELIGLERFVPALGEQTWWSSPTLITRDDRIAVILMAEVEGEVLNSTSVSAEEGTTMFRLAGQFIRKLHNLDISAPDNLGAAEYLRNRLEYYLGEGEASIDTGTVDWARGLIEQACAAEDAKRVPCHMDFSPRNWLIQRSKDGIRFGVIDWEHARWDLWLQDAQRMAYDDWHRKPHLREAYFEGYGREPTEAEALQLDAICLVTTIASIPWAVSHNDDDFAALSREVIERIRAKSR
jgi:thiamine kinase-like enzyme